MMTTLHGNRDQLFKEASRCLYEFAVNGCEQAKQRLMALDEQLARRGDLTLVTLQGSRV